VPSLTRSVVLCTIILLGLMLAPAAVIAISVGGVPAQITAPLVEQWPLLKLLWTSNADAAMHVVMEQPLITIADAEPASGGATWRVSYYPISLAAQLAVAVFASLILSAGGKGATGRRLVTLLPGTALLVFVTTYVQVATCCTGGPRWALDLWLFSLASNAPDAWIDWQPIYAWTEGKVSALQIALALLGVATLVPAALHARTSMASALRNKSA